MTCRSGPPPVSEEDARAEGVELLEHVGADQVIAGDAARRTHSSHPHVAAFAALWDELASEGTAWADNPWVWAIRFERVTLKPALRPGYGCPGCGWSDHMCDCPERFLRRRS